MSPLRLTRRALLALGLILAAGSFSAGCKAWDPGFKDEFANWGEKARANNKNPSDTGSLGLSSRSRQIERNLGVQ